MAEPEKKEVKQAEAANDKAQAAADVETDQGYRGDKADPTPNEHYTVAGVVAKLPTPETDPKAAAEAGSTKFR